MLSMPQKQKGHNWCGKRNWKDRTVKSTNKNIELWGVLKTRTQKTLKRQCKNLNKQRNKYYEKLMHKYMEL